MKSIVLGGGCSWCVEAVYQQVKGVSKVVSGYAGGKLANPTYENHGSHAEVVQVCYDPKVVELKTLYEIFFTIHDPTQVNRQGVDIGKQYRSIILAKNYLEVTEANEVIDGIRALWSNPVVTEVTLLEKFYPAEEKQQDFAGKYPDGQYCQVMINPKLNKLRQNFNKYLID